MWVHPGPGAGSADPAPGDRLPSVGPVRLMTVRVSGTVGADVSRDNTFPMGGVQRSEDRSSDDWSP